MHHDLRMVSVASKDDSESAADTASDRTTFSFKLHQARKYTKTRATFRAIYTRELA